MATHGHGHLGSETGLLTIYEKEVGREGRRGCRRACDHLRGLARQDGADASPCLRTCLERATLRQIECVLKARNERELSVCPY